MPKQNSQPEKPTVIKPLEPWNCLYITTWAYFLSQKSPTNSFKEAKVLSLGAALRSPCEVLPYEVLRCLLCQLSKSSVLSQQLIESSTALAAPSKLGKSVEAVIP